MGDVVNLNRFRKTKLRDDKQRQAEANRIRYGRTAAEKSRDEAEAERRTTELDGKQVE